MALEAANLSFGYRPGQEVLRAVSASFEPGVLTALVGPNGAGKSTLLRLLAGVLKPQSGAATLDGTPILSMSLRDRARRMAYVAQRSTPAFAFTLRQYVGLGRFAAGESDDQRAIAAALQSVDLAGREYDLFGTLSVGQQQRASLARALAQLDLSHPPSGSRILLLDEPVSAMDPRHALETLTLLKQLTARGLAVVAVLHDLTLVSRFCDRVVILNAEGRVTATGPTEQALTPAALESVFGVTFTQARLGDSSTLLVPSLPAAAR